MRVKRGCICIILAFIIVLSVLPSALGVARRVRVGFYYTEGYQMMDADGKKSGYAYDYLQNMLLYANWDCEYVGYDYGWSEASKQLTAGNIDLLLTAIKTEEREKLFDYSSLPISTSSSCIYVRAESVSPYVPGDYASYNGMVIGIMRGTVYEKSLPAFAQEKGFWFTPKLYSSAAELNSAVISGEVDAVITSNMRSVPNTFVLDSFSETDVYAIVQKGNESLLAEVNYALESVAKYHPTLKRNLIDKYYASDFSAAAYLNVREKDFLKQCTDSNKTFYAVINPDRFPYSYYEDGEFKGILVDIAAKIIERSGLNIEIVPCRDRETYLRLVKSEEVVICLDAPYDFNYAESVRAILTRPYYASSISRLTKRNFTGVPKRAAVIAQSDIANTFSASDAEELIYFAHVDECVDAVMSGDCDCAYLYTATAQSVLYNDVTNSLMCATLSKSSDFAVGVMWVENSLAASILDKAIASISKSEIYAIADKYTTYGSRKATLTAFVYSNPLSSIFFILIAAAAIILLLVFVIMLSRRRSEKKRAYDFERFIGYICAANDHVAEVDLEKHTKTVYHFESGKIITDVMTNYSKEAEFRRLVHPDDLAATTPYWSDDAINELIDNARSCFFECRVLLENNTYEWFMCILMGMARDEEHRANFMIIKRNINSAKVEEQKKNDILRDAFLTAERATDAKSQFTSRISHEIRTPLNAIIGYGQIASNSLENEAKLKYCLARSDMAAKHLLGIINDVLDLSSIESGKIKIAHEKFNFAQFASSVGGMFHARAQESGITFEMVLSKITYERFVGDMLRLNQILFNLLSNAIKFTPEGGSVTLAITQCATSSKDVHMRFAVTDTGIGMSRDFLSRIFTPYEQQDASIAKNYGGTGLGLTITKNLVTLLGGAINVESEEGKGSTFTVDLPLEIDFDVTESESAQADYSALRVLIADSNADSYEYLSMIFKNFAIEALVAKNGAEVKEALLHERCDLCVIDTNIAGAQSAKDIIESIREELQPDADIVLIADYDCSGGEEYAEQYAVAKVLPRPIFASDISDFLATRYGFGEHKEPIIHSDFDFSGNRVLLVEDNAMNLEIACEILLSKHFEVEKAVNGKEALEKFTAAPPHYYDLILMDIQMPLMNGYDATRAIRESRKEDAASIPILAMTANAFSEDVAAALSCGMNDHIAKPIDIKTLFSTISKYIKKRS